MQNILIEIAQAALQARAKQKTYFRVVKARILKRSEITAAFQDARAAEKNLDALLEQWQSDTARVSQPEIYQQKELGHMVKE